MKRLVLISVSLLSLNGCVYHSPPYGHSRYTTVTPVYPQRSYNYYTPAPPPPPRHHYHEREHEEHEHEHRPHFQRHYRSW